MKPKIIVTGSNGFVGSLLCEELVVQGYHVCALTRSKIDKHASAIEHIQITELNNLDTIEGLFDDCYAVIHLAAKVHIKNANDISGYRQINTQLTEHLAKLAAKNNVKKFIYLSTIKVNGDNTDNAPYTTESIPRPTDAYAISKFEAEKLLMDILASTSMDVTVLRPVLMYGPGIKGNLYSLMKLVSKKLPLPLGGIKNKRSLLNVRNLNSLIVECLQNTNAAGKVFLAADGVDVSTTDIIQSISRAMKFNIKLFSMPRFIVKFSTSAMGKSGIYDRLYGNLQVDMNYTKDTLNWVPPYTFDEGIDEMVSSFKRRNKA